ncbi:MAG TPA: 50S ribosomal protein L4 [Bacteroidales bacterium]|nr:50S ribosomal protein L4 [Bacteroidales bacterium]
MELTVFNIKGESTGRTVTLNDELFNVDPNDHAIYLDVKQYLANQRQGTHSTLEKSTISGSTKKIKRQKGTGGARAGSMKSPLFRGGARIFGPQPRDYNFKLNKKLKKVARRSALAYKIQNEGFTVVENFSIESPKTRQVVEILKLFKTEGQRVLFVMHENDRNLVLSTRNLPDARVIQAENLNTYDILHAGRMLVLEGSLPKIETIIS